MDLERAAISLQRSLSAFPGSDKSLEGREELGLTAMNERRLYLDISGLPEVMPRKEPSTLPAGFCPAPLVACVVEPAAIRHLQIVAAYLYSERMLPPVTDDDANPGSLTTTEPLFDEDVRDHLRRRLNAFARLESNLWWYAANGGYPIYRPTRFDTT